MYNFKLVVQTAKSPTARDGEGGGMVATHGELPPQPRRAMIPPTPNALREMSKQNLCISSKQISLELSIPAY